MACEQQVSALEEVAKRFEAESQAALERIAVETEQRSSALASEFEQNQDLAAGVGAAAGATLGGLVGGAPGSAPGAVVGKAIGSLFVLEIGKEEKRITFDVPQVTMKPLAISFDLPSVVMRDTDVRFNIPTLVMRRVKGPSVPRTVTRMVTKCVGPSWARICTDVPEVTITWDETWLDAPTYEPLEHRIVIGMPTVEMRKQAVTVNVPDVVMQHTEMVFHIPVITLRFVKDAGRRTAAAAAAIARDAEAASEKAKLKMQTRLSQQLLGPTNDVFDCARTQLERSKAEFAAPFDLEIGKLTDALTSLLASGAPETDDDVVGLRRQLGAAVASRTEAVGKFDKALSDLADQRKKTIEALVRV